MSLSAVASALEDQARKSEAKAQSMPNRYTAHYWEGRADAFDIAASLVKAYGEAGTTDFTPAEE